jgi:hypothetical protein
VGLDERSDINSAGWDWDSASTPEAWKHSHNYVHHTYTNIRGKDRDLGYEIMRIDPHQRWHPVYLFQPLYNLLLAAFFEWGVAAHDLNYDEIKSGEKSKAQVRRELKGMAGKARRQIAKDYIAYPLLSSLIMAIPDHLAAQRRAEPEGRLGKLKGGCAGASGASRAAVPRSRATRRCRCSPARPSLDAEGELHRQHRSQCLGLRDHLLRPLPRPDLHVQQGGSGRRVTRRLLRPPAPGGGEHRGRPAVPRHQREPRLPGRAPPLPGHAEHALRRDRSAGEGHLRALRPAVQHRPVPQAARNGAAHDPAARLPGGHPRPKPGPYRFGNGAGRAASNGGD